MGGRGGELRPPAGPHDRNERDPNGASKGCVHVLAPLRMCLFDVHATS